MPTDSPVDTEQQTESSSGRTSNTHTKSTIDSPDLSGTGAVHDEGKLILTEDEALERARRLPKDEKPIDLCCSVDDRDNSRN